MKFGLHSKKIPVFSNAMPVLGVVNGGGTYFGYFSR